MLKKIEKMQIITVLQDIDADKLNIDDLFSRADNFEMEARAAKAQMGVFGIIQAEERYQSRYGNDAGLKFLQALKV